MIVDTDILIWHFRGVKKASDFLDDLDVIKISSITYMELIQGSKNKNELRYIKNVLIDCGVEIIQVNKQMSSIAMNCVEQYALSHALELTDALIGATAIYMDEPLITGNKKHFQILSDKERLNLHIFRLTN